MTTQMQGNILPSPQLTPLLPINIHSIYSPIITSIIYFLTSYPHQSPMNTQQPFKIHFTKEQKHIINSLLPPTFSLQLIPSPNHKPVGRPSLKRLSPQKSEEPSLGRSENESKRRRHKMVDEGDE